MSLYIQGLAKADAPQMMIFVSSISKTRQQRPSEVAVTHLRSQRNLMAELKFSPKLDWHLIPFTLPHITGLYITLD